MLRPALSAVAVAAGVLALADWGNQAAGDSFFPSGPLDETAHLLTALFVVWAVGRRLNERLIVPALVASVAIDLDHVPQYLGAQFLTAGTPRPYTHSLLTIAVVLGLAAVWGRRRTVLLGVALGLVVHFWRDLSEQGTGVALAWPVSDHSFSLPHWSYVAVMVVLAGIAGARAWGLGDQRRAPPTGGPDAGLISRRAPAAAPRA